MVDVDEPNEEPTHRPRRKRGASGKALQLASNPSARAAFIVVGVIGLAALAVAIVGPKRVRRDVLEPLRDAVEPRFQKAWDEVGPLRDQIASVLEKAGPEARKQLAGKFQSWIGHFRAE